MRVGSSFVAIVEAGHILRFDQRSLALNGELLSARKASALGPASEHDVVVGYESGRIARLNVSALRLETLGMVPGVPVWIGEAPDQELVVVYGRRGLRTVAAKRFGLSAYRAKWMTSGAEVAVDAATAFFADSSGRLWLGVDHGEWGGHLQVMDLRTREVRSFAGFDDNVYGFVEPKPGEVWAHGGVLHMGMIEAFITRVAPGATPQRLFHDRKTVVFDSAAARRWRARAQPHAPITHIVRLPTGKLLVFAYGEAFETDVKGRAFRFVTELHLRQSPGRSDAVASYPATQAVHVEPDRIVLASARDGYVTLHGDRVASHAVHGQIATRAHAIFASDEMLIVFDHVASLRTQGPWRDVPMRPFDEVREGPALPPGTEQALVEAALKRVSKTTDRHRSSTPWDGGTLLVATDAGLCVMPESRLQSCTPVELEGIDDTASVVGRDSKGRVWLAGRGLWFLDETRRAIPVHASLPFIADAEVESLTMLENSIVLALGSRGLATLNLSDMRQVSESSSLPPVDEWDRRQAHEPKRSDGAVFVTAPPDPWPPRAARERYDLRRRLNEVIADSSQPIYPLEGIAPVYGEILAAFGSSDSDALVQLITRALEREPLRATLRVLQRRGSIGTPLVEVRWSNPTQ